MSAVSAISVNTKTTCPHGLPMGACPICNGMGGGGNRRMEEAPKKQEWSYGKCYAVWQMMKAAELNKDAAQLRAEQLFNVTQNMQQNLNRFITTVQTTLLNIEKSLPPILQKTFAKVVSNVINPLLNFVAKLPQVFEKIQQFIDNVRTQIMAATEKLAALLGEVKGFIEKKMYDSFKKIKKKFFGLFGLSEEESYSEEDIEIFKSIELKKVKNAILRLRKKGDNSEYLCD